MEPSNKAGVELEISGQIFGHLGSWTELLSVCSISRARGSGLAATAGKITEFGWQIFLWLSWTVFSFGELTITIFAETEGDRSVVSGLFVLLVVCETVGLSSRFTTASSFGISYR